MLLIKVIFLALSSASPTEPEIVVEEGGPVGPAVVDEIRLVGGDTISATIVERTGSHLIVDHAALGRLEIPLEQIETVDGRALGPPPVESEEPERAPADAPKEWESALDLSFVGAFGNTDEQSFRVGFKAIRERTDSRLTLDATYYLGLTDGDRTDNKLTAGVLHDWLIPDSRWFFFGQGRYDYDEFESWEYRLAAHGGVGYHLVERDDFNLDLRGGVGGRWEFNSVNEGFAAEILLGVDFTWQISDRQALTFASTAFPDLDDTGEFRTLSKADWTMKLADDLDLSLNAGISHEYQSIVDPGTDRNDYRLYAGIQLGF